jgi:hypothetical protein
MARNKLEDLRNHLFEVIEMLKDGDMEIDRARAIADVAAQINNSAKTEVQYLSLLQRAGYEPVTQNSLLPSPQKSEE